MYLALTLWNVPTTPRLKIDQKPSIVLVWTAPTTCCFLLTERRFLGNKLLRARPDLGATLRGQATDDLVKGSHRSPFVSFRLFARAAKRLLHKLEPISEA
jgi:hypothetical protein